MTSISFGIIMFAYFIPIYVVPLAIGVSGASTCTDYDCANSAFTKCGGYSSSEGDSGNSDQAWTRGMHGMLCMIGLEKVASANAYQMSPRLIIVAPSD